MAEFFRNLFSNDFMPHGHCYFWEPGVLWLNVISDALIALSYYAIPFVLFTFARKRRDLNFKGIFVAFGVFILACGTTHLMGVWTVWEPTYRLDGLIKAITAASSIATAVLLVPLVPVLNALPSPSQLARINTALASEVAERKTAERAARQANAELECRVEERTAELKQNEEKLRKAQEELLQSQKMEAIGRLAGGVAHDFNNLLTVISGFNEILAKGISDRAELLDYAREIGNAAGRASELTSQLLTFSRRQMIQPAIIDLNGIVGRADKMLRRLIGEDIELTVSLDPNLGQVEADPGQMEQIILNLAVNARDAMPSGGHLIIETANIDLVREYGEVHIGLDPGPYVRLAITDTGIGMDAETRRRLFEPFFTTKGPGSGTGLGLSIVYGIVKQNGGDILVYSEPGKGTTFNIYLPRRDSVAQPQESAEPAVRKDSGSETILVVEDEPGVLKLVRNMLQRHGYTVLSAGSPGEAVRVSSEYQGGIDLLLTDVVMPQASGADVAKTLTTARPGLKVLFMSGYAETGIVRHGLLEPGLEFIQKPFTTAALTKKVRDVLDEPLGIGGH